mmetsp:Transcript_58184/g.115336  ORF Transcript_58184/g.115336 Transcript_58184/m.115336 type:complete len:130 (-) Transcript_58184:1293-1682(-)
MLALKRHSCRCKGGLATVIYVSDRQYHHPGYAPALLKAPGGVSDRFGDEAGDGFKVLDRLTNHQLYSIAGSIVNAKAKSARAHELQLSQATSPAQTASLRGTRVYAVLMGPLAKPKTPLMRVATAINLP